MAGLLADAAGRLLGRLLPAAMSLAKRERSPILPRSEFNQPLRRVPHRITALITFPSGPLTVRLVSDRSVCSFCSMRYAWVGLTRAATSLS